MPIPTESNYLKKKYSFYIMTTDFYSVIEIFIKNNVVKNPHTYLNAEFIFQKMLPYLHSNGLTNNINFENLPDIYDLIGNVMSHKYELLTDFVQMNTDSCMSCGQELSYEFRGCYGDCGIKGDGKIESYYGKLESCCY